MAATDQDALVRRGGSYILAIEVEGLPNLDGKALHYRVAARANATADALSIDVITTTDATAYVPLTTERTGALKAALYYHELYMVEVDDERHVLMTGALEVQDARAARHEVAAAA